MNSYALQTTAGWRELAHGEPIIIGDVATSYASMLAWSPQYRTANDIKVIADDEIPEGKIATGSHLEDRDGKPVRVWDLEDAPAAEPQPIVLYPADLWRRASDEECEQIEAAMNSQSAKLRNLFRTAQTYQSNDPLWPVLHGAAVQLFGEEKAAELLAASE